MICGAHRDRYQKMLSTDTPFVLLDDARVTGGAPARLFCDPLEVFSADRPEHIAPMFDTLRRARAMGKHVAGYMGYEAGVVPDCDLGAADPFMDKPLAWFGIFDTYQQVDGEAIPSWLPSANGAFLSPFIPDISVQDYAKAFASIQDYINAGDIYQANLTFRAHAKFAGDPLSLYGAIRPNAAAGYGGIVWTGREWLLSFSPELFFNLKDRRITTKPMKGTALRMVDPAADAGAIDILRNDPKQCAENLMIVDLLRNDMSRVCDPGSVHVPDLYCIESYPTVHQMTSTVTGNLQAGYDAVDVLSALFPCGSITGAPKIRAMQIIDEVENSPRGPYCGSIGYIDANGDAAFNVAIRTFYLRDGDKQVSLGLGSGVVADSNERDEWAECLAKGNFAKMTGHSFDLIETMRFEPAEGILRLELHLERMQDSARALGFEFDRHSARNGLHAVTFYLEKASKVRMLLAKTGAISIETRDAPAPPSSIWRVATVPLPVAPHDFRLCHKTSDRGFYDDARIGAGNVDEVIFVDADGYLSEGSFTSLFVERDGMLLTPPVSRGLLPSVLRRELIDNGRAIETDLRVADLENGFLLGNSLRGLHVAKRVA